MLPVRLPTDVSSPFVARRHAAAMIGRSDDWPLTIVLAAIGGKLMMIPVGIIVI